MSRTTAIDEIWLTLRLAALDLDRAIEESDGSVELDVDLQGASYAVHRALVALGPTERPPSWSPPRLVRLTLDEAVVAMGVMELLSDEVGLDPWLDRLAASSIEKVRARIRAVGVAASEEWADILEV